MKDIFQDIKKYYYEFKEQDFAFFMVAAYLVFSYWRPQTLFPIIDFLPWTQLSILAGLGYLALKGKFKFQTAHFALLVFILIILISAYSSYYPEISYDKLDVMFVWLTEVFFFTNCIRTLKQYRLITIFLFLMLFKMSLFGARTWVERGFGFRGWGIAGPEGFFANSGEFSLLMAMLAVMSIAFILGHKDVKKLYYLLPVTAIMTVLGASSRGGQLALLGAMLVIVIVIGKLRLKTILIVTLATVLVVYIMPEEQMDRFSQSGEDGTSETRLDYWTAGLEMMNKHKWFGVGYYTFPEYYHDYYYVPLESNTYSASRKEVAHNSLIGVGSTLGYVGLACYLWIIYLSHNFNVKTRKIAKQMLKGNELTWVVAYTVGIDAAIVAYLIGSFFMSVQYYPYVYLLLMLTQSLKNSVLVCKNKM